MGKKEKHTIAYNNHTQLHYIRREKAKQCSRKSFASDKFSTPLGKWQLPVAYHSDEKFYEASSISFFKLGYKKPYYIPEK